ncbi:hypothetical protein HII31_12652 [Pseudocercospora fuligena]|uniref:Uncharacterized protein n=1 Tax=Pseudocercospora fuligena TaxID=685502 RepID=A0A8H6R7N4_9PEZI|nr:hypothetical protein HII31_12652 [Pseudocercospora fuligena]
MFTTLICLSSLWLIVRAQYADDLDTWQSLCNETIADANTTGTFPFPQDFGDTLGFPINASWLYTIYQNDSTLQATWWYNTGGANYSDSIDTRYDVCAISIQNVTANANYAGQQDDGSCSAALGTECVNALNDLIEDTAGHIAGAGVPTADIADDALETACTQLERTVREQFPSECKDLYQTPDILGIALSTSNKSSSDCVSGCPNIQVDGCPIFPEGVNRNNDLDGGLSNFTDAFWSVYMGVVPGPNSTDYDDYNHILRPMATVFLPPQSRERTNTLNPRSHLTCLRTTMNNPGSRTVAAMVSPPPVASSDSLSGGAIAGIVVGIVATLTVAASALWWFLRRRRKQRLLSLTSESSPMPEAPGDAPRGELDSDAEKKRQELSPMQEKYEMPTDANKPEMQGDLPQYEVPNSERKVELEDTAVQEPAELPAPLVEKHVTQ